MTDTSFELDNELKEVNLNIGLSNIGLSNIGLSNIGLSNIGLSNIGLSNIGLSDIGLSDIGLSDIGLSDIGLSNIDITEICLSNISSPPKGNELLLEMKKKKILKNIKDLNLFEQQEIFKIIKKYNVKFSENSNGVFINMNKLNKRTMNEIEKFINYCNSNKNLFQKENNIRENLKEFIENKISREKKENNIVDKLYNEEIIEQGISYLTDIDGIDDIEDKDDKDDIVNIDYSKKTLNIKENVKSLNNEFDKKIIEYLNII